MDFLQELPLVWTAFTLLMGVLTGLLLGSGFRVRASHDLMAGQNRLKVLELKAEHQRFGVTDLELRVRECDQQATMMHADLELLHSTYDRLNGELQGHWDRARVLKTQHVEQQAEIARLQEELAKWKSQLAKLQDMVDEGEYTEDMLHKELRSGLNAMCEQVGPQLGVAQQILMDCKVELAADGPERVIGALSAKVELLNNQVRYWQDSTTGISDFESDAANDTLEICPVSAAELDELVDPEGVAKQRLLNHTTLEERLADAVLTAERSIPSESKANGSTPSDDDTTNVSDVDEEAQENDDAITPATLAPSKKRGAKRTPRRRRRKGPMFNAGRRA